MTNEQDVAEGLAILQALREGRAVLVQDRMDLGEGIGLLGSFGDGPALSVVRAGLFEPTTWAVVGQRFKVARMTRASG